MTTKPNVFTKPKKKKKKKPHYQCEARVMRLVYNNVFEDKEVVVVCLVKQKLFLTKKKKKKKEKGCGSHCFVVHSLKKKMCEVDFCVNVSVGPGVLFLHYLFFFVYLLVIL